MATIRQNYDDNDWEVQRPLIEELYVQRRLSKPKICERLQNNGFRVDKGQLKRKLREWGLGQKNTERQIWTAIQLAIELSPTERAENDLTFRIQTRFVSFDDIRRYCWRKNSKDPFVWAQSLSPGKYERSSDVQIVPGNSSHSDISESSESGPLPPATAGQEIPDQAAPSPQPTVSTPTAHRAVTTLVQLSPPAALRLTERLISLADSYCAMHLRSRDSLSNIEPAVHMDTIHGKFGSQMQDALFHALHLHSEQAFKSFNQGFDQLKSLLRNENPLALSQVFAIISELAEAVKSLSRSSHGSEQHLCLEQLLRMLVHHLAGMAQLTLAPSHPLQGLLRAMVRAEDVANTVIKVMQRMLKSFEENESNKSWRQLYLKERYCDALFQAKLAGERQILRKELLAEQEVFYWKTKSNVLWTLTNVADDYLEHYQTRDAEDAYREAIRRADAGLEGYAKAKIRFAAFEGLAKVAMMRDRLQPAAEIWRQSTYGNASGWHLQPNSRILELNRAIQALQDAEKEAECFGTDNRRLLRVRHSQQVIMKEIEGIQEAQGEHDTTPHARL